MFPDPEPLEPLLARLEGTEQALLGLGIPRCPACRLLPATLSALRAARPALAVGIHLFAGPEDWLARESALWPRGIRVSRSSVPVLVLLRGGEVVAQRPGSAPAHVLDAWLTEALGPAQRPLAASLTPGEEATLDAMAARRGQHDQIRSRDSG